MKVSDLGIGMDQYDRRARLMPALLVLLPATLAVVAVAPDAIVGWSGGIALIVQAGGSFLLAQIVGDIGKRKEPALFDSFGGRPTERMLCHEHASNRILLAERHRKLAKLFPKLKIPTAESEKKDRPAGARGLRRLRRQDPRPGAGRQGKVPARPPRERPLRLPA